VIGDLQQKLLRESERVAVATQIDARKDDYLGKLRSRYEGTAVQWQNERDKMMFELTEKNEMCSATIQVPNPKEKQSSKKFYTILFSEIEKLREGTVESAGFGQRVSATSAHPGEGQG